MTQTAVCKEVLRKCNAPLGANCCALKADIGPSIDSVVGDS